MTAGEDDTPEQASRPWWWYAPFAVCGVLFLAHFGLVLHHAVDIPYRDEWELLRPDALPSGLTWEWLSSQQNGHRVLLTRLQVWVLYHLNGWHQPTHQALNFVLYGGLLATVGVHTVRLGLSAPAAAWFLVPLLSPITWENHGYGMDSCMHLSVLGPVLVAWGLFDPKAGLRPRALAAVGLVISVTSFTAGVVLALPLVLVWLCVRADSRTAAGRRELVLIAGTALLCLAWWASGWERAGGEADPTSPLSWVFWEFALNLVSLGFGFQTVSAALGLLCLALVVSPALLLVWRRRRDAPWGAIAFLLGCGLVFASIAHGRAHWTARYAKASRYAGVALFLLPYSAVLWQALWRDHPRRARGALVVLWALAGLGLADDWSGEPYRQLAETKREGLRVARAYYRGELTRPVRCPALFHGRDLAPLLDEAQALNLSFVRGLEED